MNKIEALITHAICVCSTLCEESFSFLSCSPCISRHIFVYADIIRWTTTPLTTTRRFLECLVQFRSLSCNFDEIKDCLAALSGLPLFSEGIFDITCPVFVRCGQFHEVQHSGLSAGFSIWYWTRFSQIRPGQERKINVFRLMLGFKLSHITRRSITVNVTCGSQRTGTGSLRRSIRRNARTWTSLQG